MLASGCGAGGEGRATAARETGDQAMANDPVKVQLSVSPAGRSVAATLTFTNISKADVFIWKLNACDGGKIENDLFEIFKEDKQIPYVGKLAKRQPPGPADFVKLTPGAKVDSKVALETAYEFPPGPGNYRAKYSALNPYPDRAGFFSLDSEEVRFTLK
jgi:hypothetical protein